MDRQPITLPHAAHARGVIQDVLSRETIWRSADICTVLKEGQSEGMLPQEIFKLHHSITASGTTFTCYDSTYVLQLGRLRREGGMKSPSVMGRFINVWQFTCIISIFSH